jgi:solute carrier family 13 (sodium-dependent dicarboxylate transporter), member 2/3/5
MDWPDGRNPDIFARIPPMPDDDATASSLPGEPESGFDWWRQRVGLGLGPLVMAVLLVWPVPGVSVEAQRLAAVMALAVVFWMTEAIPMAATALLAPALCIVLGVAKDKEVLAPFASPSIFLFIGSFILAAAMARHGLDRRLALWLLTRPGVLRSPFTLYAALGGMTALLSMWMSNVATTAVMIPIALGVLATTPQLAARPRAQADLILLIAFSASVGGLGTPVGTPPNIIAIGYLRQLSGVPVSFLDWMKLGVPLVVVLMVFLLWLLRPRGVVFTDRSLMEAELRQQREALGPLRPGERNTAVLFALAISLWMLPGLSEIINDGPTPAGRWLAAHLPEETIGLLCGLMVFFLPVNLREWRFTLTWKEAERIDWGTILLFAGGLSLGTLIFNTGLAKTMGNGMSAWLGTPTLWGLVAAGIVLSLVLSEATSNTASANVMVPLMIAVAQGAQLPVIPVALAVSLACSFGFMLPVSTGPNALAYGTGLVPLKRMMRSGIALDAVGAVAILAMVWLIYR